MNNIGATNACRVCLGNSVHLFDGLLLDKLKVGYFECQACGYVQTEEPSWLVEAYERPITASDTGIMIRNEHNLRIVLSTLFLLNNLKGTVVDFAGGYGILVRMLRDVGVDAFWSDRFSKNLLASGFEYQGGPALLTTAFEAFEHFVKPAEELERLFTIAPNVLLSTVIIPRPTPLLSDWWYYGQEHGQHIGFFRVDTLRFLASRYGKRLLTDGKGYHLFLDKVIPLWKWRLIIKMISTAPRLITSSLEPKFWSDHLLMSNKSHKL